MTWTVRLDVRTKNPLNGSQGMTAAGRRMRTAERRRLRAMARMHCGCTQVSATLRGQCIELPLVIALTRIAPRPLDDDGWQAAAKPIRDGCADWLGIKDNDPRVTWEYAQRKGRVREHAVEIEMRRRP